MSDFTSGLLEFLTGVARFVNRGVGAHCNGIAKLVSSVSEALKLESRPIIEILCAGEREVLQLVLILMSQVFPHFFFA